VIKYRAWHKKLNKMLDWDELIAYGNSRFTITNSINIFEDKDLEFMRLVDLKDEDGGELYEEDIVYFTNAQGLRNATVKIYYDTDFFKYCIGNKVIEEDLYDITVPARVTKVGNSYENPELEKEA